MNVIMPDSIVSWNAEHARSELNVKNWVNERWDKLKEEQPAFCATVDVWTAEANIGGKIIKKATRVLYAQSIHDENMGSLDESISPLRSALETFVKASGENNELHAMYMRLVAIATYELTIKQVELDELNHE